MGFGVDSKDADYDHYTSIMSVLRMDGLIGMKQVAYNITYRPDDSGTEHVENSYIQLGHVSKSVEDKVTWL